MLKSILILFVIALVALQSMFVVQEWEQCVILEFGKPVRIIKDPGLYFKVPLIQDLILVSGRDSGLSPKTRSFLAGLKQPVTLQVFVTPT